MHRKTAPYTLHKMFAGTSRDGIAERYSEGTLSDADWSDISAKESWGISAGVTYFL